MRVGIWPPVCAKVIRPFALSSRTVLMQQAKIRIFSGLRILLVNHDQQVTANKSNSDIYWNGRLMEERVVGSVQSSLRDNIGFHRLHFNYVPGIDINTSGVMDHEQWMHLIGTNHYDVKWADSSISSLVVPQFTFGFHIYHSSHIITGALQWLNHIRRSLFFSLKIALPVVFT